jgi:hypothetical protein
LSKDVPEPVYDEHGVKWGKREIEGKRRTEDLSVAVKCKGVFRVKARRGWLPLPLPCDDVTGFTVVVAQSIE